MINTMPNTPNSANLCCRERKATWFSFEEMLSLDGRDLRHSGENMSAACCSPLQTVTMIDLSITCLLIYIKLQREREKGDSG